MVKRILRQFVEQEFNSEGELELEIQFALKAAKDLLPKEFYMEFLKYYTELVKLEPYVEMLRTSSGPLI